MKAPPRLRDDPTVAAELRKDLERSAQAEPNYDAAAGLAVFSAAIVAGAASSAAGTAAAAGQTGAATKVAGVLGSISVKGAVAAIGTAAVVAVTVANLPSRPNPAPKGKPAASKAAPHAARAHAATPQPVAKAPTDSPAAAQALAPMRADAAETSARQPEQPESAPRNHAASFDASARREIAQLGRIKVLLDESDPRAALRLAEAGHREFGRGLLREEREGLAILALWKLGRTQQAEPRTRTFLNRYPRSALGEQLAARLHGTE